MALPWADGGGMEGTIATFPSLPEPEVPAGGMILKLAIDGGCGTRRNCKRCWQGGPPGPTGVGGSCGGGARRRCDIINACKITATDVPRMLVAPGQVSDHGQPHHLSVGSRG